MTSLAKITELEQPANISDVLRSTFLFSHIPEDMLSLFSSKAIVKKYAKGNVLFLNGDSAEFFYVIAKGWVKLFRETLDGEEALLDVLNEGYIFGETVIFENNTALYSAEVVEDATLLRLPLSLLQQKIKENDQLSTQMFSAMSRSLKRQGKELEHRDLKNAPQRISCFLLRLCNTNVSGTTTIHLPYDKMLIASRLGMKSETFSRSLARLRKETGIRINGATIEIDKIEKLSNYSCSICSSTYPCHNCH